MKKLNFAKISVNNFVESKVSVISFIGFWVAFCYASVLSFLAAYAQEIHLVEAGTFFFVVYAVVITISRPITGIIFDAKGENYVMYPCFVCLAIGLFLIKWYTNCMDVIISWCICRLRLWYIYV